MGDDTRLPRARGLPGVAVRNYNYIAPTETPATEVSSFFTFGGFVIFSCIDQKRSLQIS